MLKSVFTVFLLAELVLGCKSSTVGAENSVTTSQVKISKGPGEVSVMTFNVENTFDNVHNDGVDDFTYLPLAKKNTPEVKAACDAVSISFYRGECHNKDWNDAIVDFKLSQIAKVIRFVDNGQGPDVLLMAEVENENILNQLVQKHLGGLGYQTISILKGPDTRGINTAVISKFPVAGKPILNLIPYTDPNPEAQAKARNSRAILEVTLKINKKDVTFLSAHFPSQSNPTEWRRQAMEHMKMLMMDYQAKGRAVVAGGDLNTTEEEEENNGFFGKILSQAGQVSHLVGCKQCKGTHNYRGGWSFLDILIFGNGLKAGGLELIPDSIEVVKAPVQTKRNGTPLRFDEQAREGVSDHFPLYSRLKILQ